MTNTDYELAAELRDKIIALTGEKHEAEPSGPVEW